MLTLMLIVVVIALLFAIAWLYSRGVIIPAAALLWIGFVPYEFWIRANCPGDCNIRADLVLILPVLLIAFLAAVVSVIQKVLRKRKAARAGT
jgi:hypothetical protein